MVPVDVVDAIAKDSVDNRYTPTDGSSSLIRGKRALGRDLQSLAFKTARLGSLLSALPFENISEEDM